jgi:hypothetical protein
MGEEDTPIWSPALDACKVSTRAGVRLHPGRVGQRLETKKGILSRRELLTVYEKNRGFSDRETETVRRYRHHGKESRS